MPVAEAELCTNASTLPVKVSAREARLSLRIGGISFGLYAPASIHLALDPEMTPFRTKTVAPDVRLDVDWANELQSPDATPLFDSGGLWSLFKEDGSYAFYFRTSFLGSAPYKVAWFDHEFRDGRIALARRFYDPAQPVNPLEYPLDELLAIHRLSRDGAVEVHAVGVVDEFGRGHLFVGHSGAGKSTSARLWQNRPGARILSDDRIILRFENGRARMYGTPWHGDAGLALADSADLCAIYFLEHGSRNKLTPVPVVRAAAELLARCFVPHHSAEGLEAALLSLDRITRQTPCSLFQFVPDQSAVEMIYHG
jgi:hypothetical protein